VCSHQQSHGINKTALALASIFESDEVTFVAHDPTDLESPFPCHVGEQSSLVGHATTAGQSHADIDEDLSDPSNDSSVDRLGRVDRDGDPGPGSDHIAQTAGVNDFVREQEIVAETSCGHSLHLTDRGTAKGAVPCIGQPARQRSGLECLDVGTQTIPGPSPRHGGDVRVEQVKVYNERRGRKIVHTGQS
jgi:hypothetical protein